MGSVLIIDDDIDLSEVLVRAATRAGHQAASAATIAQGLARLDQEAFDLILLDVNLPDGNGLDILPRLRSALNPPEVIIITGEGSADGAELAITNGAWDYLNKPFDLDSIGLALKRVFEYRREKLERRAPIILKRPRIIGQSPQLTVCLEQLAEASASQAGVLVYGQTGTGKELFARAIHDNGARSQGNFVVVDCASLPENLTESIIFGHVKGAFTGAEKDHIGLVKQADGGTLFLDEIGEMPLSIQKKFLRVLETQTFRPVGSKNEITSDFRLIAATNRDLDQMAAHSRFRTDLLFRLRTLTIHIPPLSERQGDIEELASVYLAKHCRRYGIATKGFSPEFLQVLSLYDWPGNVRELHHCLEKVLVSAWNDATLFPTHLPAYIRVRVARASFEREDMAEKGAEASAAGEAGMLKPLAQARQEMEKAYFKNLMEHTGRDINRACAISGLSRARLYELLKKYGLSRPS